MAHRCETISHNSRFSVAITVQKRGNYSLAHTIVHTADMAISAVQNVYDATNTLSVD